MSAYDNSIEAAEYSYDVNGNREYVEYANGVGEYYTYNLANQVTSVANKLGIQTLSSYSYTYYLDGNQASKTDHTGRITSYTYDGLGRLKQESESGAVDAITKAYTFDNRGNRTAMVVSGAESYTVEYEYDANNRIISEEKTVGITAHITDYYYDNNGNTITKDLSTLTESTDPENPEPILDNVGTELYTYDGFNRLVGVENDAGTHTYTYRPDGLRNSKAVNSTTIKHVWDGQNISIELDSSGNIIDIYTRGINLIKSTVNGYYLYNAHGDVVQLTDAYGVVTKSYEYDAFGNERSADPTDGNPFRYCGEYFDKETGTIYLRARYYDPTIGRFISEDSYRGEASDPLSLNLYTYCANNPIRYTDPTGHHWYFLYFDDVLQGFWDGLVERRDNAFESPNWYTIGNYLTLGMFDTVKGSILPEKPLSLQHWIDSVCVVTMGYGIYKAVSRNISLASVKGTSSTDVNILGKGSTGRTAANNLNEQLAMKEVMSNPLENATKVPLKNGMTDSRWLGTDGWTKMQRIITTSDGKNITIHFNYNDIIGAFDDFKFK